MTQHTYLDQGLSILHARLRAPGSHSRTPFKPAVQPFITISRQACAGATTLGGELLRLLNERSGEDDRNWIFLDKDLLQRALLHYNLPERLAEFLPEDRISEVEAVIGELVGLHPPIWELEHKVSDAILHLAKVGRVIFTGRAAHFVTEHLTGGFHVRLVAPHQIRVQRLAAIRHCDENTAANMLENTDRARERYVRTNFNQDIDDPCAYDLVINTERIAPETAAQLVVAGLERKLAALPPQPASRFTSP